MRHETRLPWPVSTPMFAAEPPTIETPPATNLVAAGYGSAELRLRLGPVAAFTLADIGRAWLEGESSRCWHAAVGGGLRVGPADSEKAFVLTAAASEGKWRVYPGGGGGF